MSPKKRERERKERRKERRRRERRGGERKREGREGGKPPPKMNKDWLFLHGSRTTD